MRLCKTQKLSQFIPTWMEIRQYYLWPSYRHCTFYSSTRPLWIWKNQVSDILFLFLNYFSLNLILYFSYFCLVCFREEHLRYIYLLRRYLEIKYPTIAEAKESFSQLMDHVEEMRQLNADIMFFFRSYAQLLQTSPLFTQLLDLDNNQPAKPSPHQNTDPFGVPVFDDPSMYSLPEMNQQQMNNNNNMGRTASVSSVGSSSTSSSSALLHQYTQYGHSTMDNNNDSTVSSGQPMSTYDVNNGTNNNSANQTSSSSPSSSSNAYRECIINSANWHTHIA